MIGYTLRRLGQAVIVLLGLTVLVFLLEHIIPGSLARAILGPRASPGEIAAFDRVNGLDRPVVAQYLTFLSHVLHGNLGYSYRLNQSVDSLVVHELPNDLILVGIAICLALAIAVPLGVAQAARRNRAFDHVTTGASFLLYSMPAYWLGLLLIAGLGSYGLGRAALSPVERLRREVAALSDTGRGATVAVPRTNDEIAALAQTMNELLARLHNALDRQRAFVADAAHELRTPFAVLQGELELASRPGRDPEELPVALGRASQEAARLTRLANDLLLLARSDEEQIEVHAEPMALRPLLLESARAFAGKAEEVGVTLRVEASDELVALLDSDRMRQAVDNLLHNASRFAPVGSEIVMAASARGHDLVIEVSDSGPGFPPDFLPHAFERFSRPDSGRARAGGGTGLGLSIVQAIVTAHGGKALAGNRAEGGATVTLELPGAVVR